MKYYIYYSKGTNEDKLEDVAVVSGKSFDDALVVLKKYFTVVNSKDIHEVNLKRDGYVQDIMILSDY